MINKMIMSGYSPFLAACTQVLISKLLLSIPELIKEIAPEGFERSAYSFIKPVSDQEAYRQYRLQRAERYKINKYEFAHGHMLELPVPETFKTFEAFCLHYKRLPDDMPIEMICILIKCIRHIFSFECVVYDQNLKSHYMGHAHATMWFFRKLLEDLHVLDYRILKKESLYWEDESTDLLPIYEFIFRKLKEQGLDWDYRNFDLAYLLYDETRWANERANDLIYQEYYETFKAAIERQANLEGREVTKADWVPYYEGVVIEEPAPSLDRWGALVFSGERELIAPCNDYGDCVSEDIREIVCETFEEEFQRIQGLAEPESGKLKTYFKVYGKWPKGYPENREDYG